MLAGFLVIGTVAGVFSDRVLWRLKSTSVANVWGLASGALLPAFLIFFVHVWARVRLRLARFRPAVVVLGGLALTLSFAGLIVSVRSDRRFTHHAPSAPIERFNTSLLLGLAPLLVNAFVQGRFGGRSSARRKGAPVSFLITGWPNGQDGSPRGH